MSEQTKRMYLRHIKRYCDEVNLTPDQLIDLKMEGQENVRATKEIQAEELLESPEQFKRALR